jgi:hypothetical protein
MSEKKKGIQYSKILPFIAVALFCVCLYMGFTADYSTVVDVSFYVTAITISGSIVAGTFIFYYRKAQQENCVKLKSQMYRIASEERLKYNEKMILLKSRYMLSEEELMEIKADSPMEAFEQQALDSINDTINQAQSEADTMVENPTF